MQKALGTALVSLGEREVGTARLEEAVHAYRAALDVFASDEMPEYRDLTQNNLAHTIAILLFRRGATGPAGR